MNIVEKYILDNNLKIIFYGIKKTKIKKISRALSENLNIPYVKYKNINSSYTNYISYCPEKSFDNITKHHDVINICLTLKNSFITLQCKEEKHKPIKQLQQKLYEIFADKQIIINKYVNISFTEEKIDVIYEKIFEYVINKINKKLYEKNDL